MLFRKDPRDVTDGEVKTLEWYLIIIPSIAAALSSTLIAMTAVHRIKLPKHIPPVTKITDKLIFDLIRHHYRPYDTHEEFRQGFSSYQADEPAQGRQRLRSGARLSG